MPFQTLATVIDDDTLHLRGVSALEIIAAEGRRYLIIAAEADSALSSFEIMADGSLVFQSEVLPDATSGTASVAGLTVMGLASGLFVVPAGRWDDDTGVFAFSTATGLMQAHSLSDPAGHFGNVLVSDHVQAGGPGFLSARQGVAGLDMYAVAADGALAYRSGVADTPTVPLGDVTALASARFHGTDFLFAASAFDAGVQVFEATAGGGLAAAGQSLRGDGLGYLYPSVLATADVDGSALLLMGATGSDTITVFRVGADGSLAAADQVADTLATRFGGIATLQVAVVNGVTYVLAGGGDDGLTLFHLSRTGSLDPIDVLADDFTTTLDNVSDTAVFVDGTTVHVLAGSASENGVTHLTADLPYATATIDGPAGPAPPPDIDPAAGVGGLHDEAPPDPGAGDFLF
ncbi:MAG: hypothetical protein ACE5FS_10530 [Paracoccaceae bacterium]